MLLILTDSVRLFMIIVKAIAKMSTRTGGNNPFQVWINEDMKDGPTRTKTTKSSPCIGPIHQTFNGLTVHSSATPSVQCTSRKSIPPSVHWSLAPVVPRLYRPASNGLMHQPSTGPTIHPLVPCTSRPPRSHHPMHPL